MIEDDPPLRLWDCLVDPGPSPEEEYLAKERDEMISAVLLGLPTVERDILEGRFGFRGEVETLDVLAKSIWGSCQSREAVRQREAKALRRLRHPVWSGLLHNYVPRLWADAYKDPRCSPKELREIVSAEPPIDPLDFPCNTCGAKAGAPCTEKGGPYRMYHGSRATRLGAAEKERRRRISAKVDMLRRPKPKLKPVEPPPDLVFALAYQEAVRRYEARAEARAKAREKETKERLQRQQQYQKRKKRQAKRKSNKIYNGMRIRLIRGDTIKEAYEASGYKTWMCGRVLAGATGTLILRLHREFAYILWDEGSVFEIDPYYAHIGFPLPRNQPLPDYLERIDE